MAKPAFHIGLNMAGAISAGAYTAGVLDYFIDALDTWHSERDRQRQAFGDNADSWTVPRHDVRVAVLSGASAGGMTAAIAAAALCEDFRPIRTIPAAGAAPANRLYKSWVADIDAQRLLTDTDLRNDAATIRSLLDSTVIDEIAAGAVQVGHPRSSRREWVAEGLKVILTLTNLVGVPYAIEAGSGSAETQTLYHADQQNFEVRWDQAAGDRSAVPLRPNEPANWALLAEAAKATGAFPLMLAPRVLRRSTTEYNQRLWRVSLEHPDCTGPDARCDAFEPLKPNWAAGDGVPFRTSNVDGGVTNNSPFDCAHRELTQVEPKPAAGHNPRSANDADRAVISVAPFLSTPTFSLDANPATDLRSVLGQLIDTLVNQSRMQGENIKLTQDPQVFSRFVVAPSIDETTVSALASACLGAFGGFIAREFRDHDYQLGRRNCQRFLQRHFGLPLDNPVIKSSLPESQQSRDRLLNEFGMELPDGSPGIALIPLLGELRNEVRVNRARIGQNRLVPVADQALNRLKLVGSRLIRTDDWLSGLAFTAGWFAVRGRLKRSILSRMAFELARQNLIE